MTTETRWIVAHDGDCINLAHVGRLYVSAPLQKGGPSNVYAEYPATATEYDDCTRLVGSYDTEADAKDALHGIMCEIMNTEHVRIETMPRDFREEAKTDDHR